MNQKKSVDETEQTLSQQLQDLDYIRNKDRADLRNEKYRLTITVWLLEEAAWQGQRDDVLSFLTLKDARKYKKIVNEMVSQQKRYKKNKIKECDQGDEELDYWQQTQGRTNFLLFWSTGDIWHEKREKIEQKQ